MHKNGSYERVYVPVMVILLDQLRSRLMYRLNRVCGDTVKCVVISRFPENGANI